MTKSGVRDADGRECRCADCAARATQADWATCFYGHLAAKSGLAVDAWLELESREFKRIVDAKKTN